MKHVFVILNYLTVDDTIECINSIFKSCDKIDYEIVVVDNGSKNNSIEILDKEYRLNTLVHIISTEVNLGFAKGNNVGYKYAKETLNADFIIMINNDTLIEQKNLLDVIEKKYLDNKPHIIGPDIISIAEHVHQNPRPINNFRVTAILKQVILNRIHILLIQLKIKPLIRSIISRNNVENSKNTIKTYDNEDWKKEIENIQLHGACLIFTPLYINSYNGLYSKTFLYVEEDILFYIAQKEKMDILYTPELVIYHKEDATTNALYGKGDKKMIFYLRNINKSLWILLRLILGFSNYKNDLSDC